MFPLSQALLQITPGRIANDIEASSITLTGSQTINGNSENMFELKVPSLNIDVKLPADGTNVALADGSKASMTVAGMDYSLFALWSVIPSSSSGKAYLALATTGYVTPPAGLPTNGAATYAQSGGAIGVIYIGPATGGLASGTLKGDANLTINFSNQNVSGGLSNMTITPTDGSAAAPWNTVNLSGSLNGSAVSGSATSFPGTSLPQNGYSFSVSYGSFNGYLYGPSGQEVGAVWTLNDSGTPNKSALGVFGAKKQ